MDDLDKAVENVLVLVDKYAKEIADDSNFDENDRIACEVAEDCAVLMKNDGILPIEKTEKIFVCGDLFEKMRYQGSGSSMINPAKLTVPLKAFDSMGIDYTFVRGYAENRNETDSVLLDEAVKRSENYGKVIVFAGLTDYVESEGADREDMKLPDNQLALIEALINAGKKVIVVLFGGSPVELPFADKVSAILNMYLPGQAGGTACANLLFGNSSPCGRLAETWPMKYSDVPFGESFAESKNEVYKESVYVGYRYYTTADIKVRYPFGYGLSYTEFKYLNIGFEDYKDVITVSGEILNTGRYRGAEIVQLYVKSPKNGGVFKPARELRAFTKVYLEPNERKKFELKAEKKSLGYFDVKKNAWVMDGGEYELQLCADCNTVYKSYTFKMDGEISSSPYEEETAEAYMNADLRSVNDVLFEKLSGQKIPPIQPCKPITLESRFTDLNSTCMGRILYNAVLAVANKQMKDAEKMQEGSEKDNKLKGAQFLKRILESNSLISMSMSAGNSFPYNFAQGFMHFANGHFIKGIKSFCQKIKAPTLPKDKKQ